MFLDLEADRALFDSKIEAIVAVIHENERPLTGLSGLLDWRFQGAISKCVRSGVITGSVGECAYIPVQKNGKVYRIILAGAGRASRPGERAVPPVDSLRALTRNLTGLKLGSIGISRKDFGSPTEDFFAKHLKGIPVQVTL